MADNVVANAGSGGATFATDQRASDSVHFPLTKLVWGALDTFTVVDTGAGGLPIADGGNSITVDSTTFATVAKQPALGTAGSASADVITVQGVASMTKLLVTPDSVALPANQTVDVNKLAGTTTDTNSGNKSAGTLRVVLATDQPALTNKLLVTPDANSAVNLAQAAGNTLLTGNGAAGSGGLRVSIASDSTGIVQDVAGTAGGSTPATLVSAANNNKTQIKGSAGQLYSVCVQNIHSAPVYLKVFDKTSANVTAGTTAADYQFMCPANATAANGAGVVFNLNPGYAHANGITVMLTLGISLTDNTSTAANIAIVTLGYK